MNRDIRKYVGLVNPLLPQHTYIGNLTLVNVTYDLCLQIRITYVYGHEHVCSMQMYTEKSLLP